MLPEESFWSSLYMSAFPKKDPRGDRFQEGMDDVSIPRSIWHKQDKSEKCAAG
jgi:hypothetical protein